MIPKSWNLMVVCLLSITCIVGAYSVPSETTVFDPSQYQGYEVFRIPAVARTNNGTLLAFAEGRHDADDMQPTDIVLKRSTNDGASWGSLIVLHDGNNDCLHNVSPVVDQTTNYVFLFYCINGQETVYQYSGDNGSTWYGPYSITGLPGDIADGGVSIGPGHGIQLQRGDHAGRLVIPWRYRRTDNKRLKQLLYSDNHGATWSFSNGYVYGGGIYRFIDEYCIAELTYGDIYFNMRNHLTSMESTDERYRIVCQSTNFLSSSILLTGSEGTYEHFDLQLPEPTLSEDSEGCHASVLKLASTDLGDGYNHIIFSNPAYRYARRYMTIRSSFDETDTWSRKKLLTTRVSDYSALVDLDEDYFGILFGTGEAPYSDKVVFCRIPKDWLTESTVAAWEFEEFEPYTSLSPGTKILNSICSDGLDGTVDSSGVLSCYRDNGDVYLNFTDFDAIVVDDSLTCGMLDFDAGETFWINAKIRTTNHGSGGDNGSGAIVAKDLGAMENSWWLRVQDGKVKFLICDGNVECTETSSVSVNDGNWHTIKAGRDVDDDKIKIFVDGILRGEHTDTTTDTLKNDEDLTIGNFTNVSRQFLGHIAYVRVELEE